MSDPLPHIYFIVSTEAKRLHKRVGFFNKNTKKKKEYFLHIGFFRNHPSKLLFQRLRTAVSHGPHQP